jgi:hypothetical protein
MCRGLCLHFGKRAFEILVIFSLVAGSLTTVLPQAHGAANIQVTYLGVVKDPRFGSLGAFGFVKNIGDKPASNITLYVRFFDASGNFINSTVSVAGAWPFTENNFVLMPGQIVSYSAFLPDELGGNLTDHSTTRCYYMETSVVPALQLQTAIINDSKNFDGSIGKVNIHAEVTNAGEATADEFYFWAVAYDSNGLPIGGTNYWNSIELLPANSRTFTLDFSTYGNPASYTYCAQSATLSFNATGSFILNPQYRAEAQNREFGDLIPTPTTSIKPTPSSSEVLAGSPSPSIPEFPIWLPITLLLLITITASLTRLRPKTARPFH